MLVLKCDMGFFFAEDRVEGVDRKDCLKHLLSHPRYKMGPN